MNYKKSVLAICLALVICISLVAVVACAPSITPDDSSEISTESTMTDDTTADSSDDIVEAYDMKGREFKILQRWFGYNVEYIDFSGEVIWADSGETGELNGIDLAKKQVLDKVQSIYNCTITGEILAKTPAEIRNFLESDLLSGAPTVDFCFETYYYYYSFVENGYLTDLNTLDINFNAGWWDSGAVKDLSINGKQFYGMGDINTYDNDGTSVLLFNKVLYTERGGDVAKLYKLAADGNWTFDVFKQKITGFGKGETYGLLTDPANPYLHLIAAGEKTVSKDENDKPIFALDNDRALKVYNDAVDLYMNSKDVLLYENLLIGISNPPDNTLTAFKEGKGLFYITTPSTFGRLDGMEDEYGILPMPKYDSSQKSYCHTVSNFGASAVFVPNSALSEGDKGKEIGILLDALGKYSKELVTPVYLDKTAPDEESKQMLETILSTRIYDLGAVFSAAWKSPESLCARMDKDLEKRIADNKSYITSAIGLTMSKIDDVTVSYSSINDDELDYTDTDSNPPMKDFYSSIRIHVNDIVKDFKFIKVFYDENSKPYAADSLYEAELLSPGDDFCVKTHINEKFSNRGVSYTNAKGEICYAVIEYNSEGDLKINNFSYTSIEAETTVYKVFSDNTTASTVSFNGTITDLFAQSGVLENGIEINRFYIVNGVAHIDFNQSFKEAISAKDNSGYNVLGSVVNTLLGYYGKFGVERVLITVDNASVSKAKLFVFDDFDGVDNTVSDGKHYSVLNMFDVYAMGDYLYPVSFDGTVEDLIATLVNESGWNAEINVNSFAVNDRVAYIDMNKAFGDRVYAGLMAESGVTCVIGTIKNYYGDQIDYVSLTIEGKPFVSDYA